MKKFFLIKITSTVYVSAISVWSTAIEKAADQNFHLEASWLRGGSNEVGNHIANFVGDVYNHNSGQDLIIGRIMANQEQSLQEFVRGLLGVIKKNYPDAKASIILIPCEEVVIID